MTGFMRKYVAIVDQAFGAEFDRVDGVHDAAGSAELGERLGEFGAGFGERRRLDEPAEVMDGRAESVASVALRRGGGHVGSTGLREEAAGADDRRADSGRTEDPTARHTTGRLHRLLVVGRLRHADRLAHRPEAGQRRRQPCRAGYWPRVSGSTPARASMSVIR